MSEEFVERVHPAHCQYDDYVGTAAADDADPVLGGQSLYEMAGIDPDRWTILGVGLSRWQKHNVGRVYALDRLENHVNGSADLLDLVDRNGGSVPVKRFHLKGQNFQDLVDDAFQRLTITLLSRSLEELGVTYEVVADSSDDE